MREWIQTFSRTSALTHKYEVTKNVIDDLVYNIKKEELVTKNKIEYYNMPVAFDIESSSFYEFSQLNNENEKVAIMYEWCICICGKYIVGRQWEQFIYLCNELSERLDLCENRRIIVYVHNLSYEFQFLQFRFKWLQVFSLDTRKPVKALCEQGIEFRCSYLLSGYSLEKLSDQLTIYKVKKKVGDLNYDLVRTYKTILTEEEWEYCMIDTLVVVAYIDELITRNGTIADLPLTKTGFVRNYCRALCLHNKGENRDNDKYHKYRNLMKRLVINDSEEYNQLKRAFQGGYTHANARYMGKDVKDVDSFDFASSYPYVLLSEKFPMSRGTRVTVQSTEQFNEYLKYKCCVFDIEFENLQSKVKYDNYISKSHCWDISNAIVDNGRIASATRLKTTITDVDYRIIKSVYRWSNARITNMIVYEKDYLPKDLILGILKFFGDKTQLKGIAGKEEEYLQSKEYLNAIYGMMVTDICRDEITYLDGWEKDTPEIDEAIDKYNKSLRRFLFYPWGIYVTAYARRNLWSGILEFKEDYHYSDTDSLKVTNAQNHMKYIEGYNSMVLLKLKMAMEYHNIDISLTHPKNKKGVEKQIGIWEHDAHYTKFKTLGAKRYIIEEQASEDDIKYHPNHIYKGKFYNITVSGLNKFTVVPYLLKKSPTKIFKLFDEGLSIPPDYTGKLTHTYIDCLREGKIKDYRGVVADYHELSGTHLEKQDYTLSISTEYTSYIAGIRKEIY